MYLKKCLKRSQMDNLKRKIILKTKKLEYRGSNKKFSTNRPSL